MAEARDCMGRIIDYDAAVHLMDDGLREELSQEIAPCTEQEFIEAYAEAHEKRFGEQFAPYSNGEW